MSFTASPRIVLLAAGQGARMQPLGHDVPKSLLPVGGEPFACRLIRQAQDRGVADVTVVVGYRKDFVAGVIRDHCGSNVQFVANDRYAEDVNIHSLSLALAADPRPCHVVEADIYLADAAWGALLAVGDADKSVWYVRGTLTPAQSGGVLAAAGDGAPLTDLRYITAYSPEYADYYKLVGVTKIGPREFAGYRARLAEYRDRDMRQYYMQPWIDDVSGFRAIARDLGADAAVSVNTPYEYRQLTRELADGAR